MKTKGITIWEQHLERIVLGIAVLVFLGFTVIQFIGNPNAVQQGNEIYTPRDVDDTLRQRADQLAARLDPDAPPPADIPDPELVSDSIVTLLAGGISPQDSLPPVNWKVGFTEVDIPEPDQEYAVPAIPAPRLVVARPYWDALEDAVVQQNEELQQLTSDAPHDMTWITAGATFSLAEVLSQFSRSDESRGLAAIPPTWYDGVQILDVKIERQELNDGQWQSQTTLDVLPGQYTLRDLINEDVDATGRGFITTQLNEPGVQRQIVQPEFYSTLNNTWVPPEVEEEGATENVALTPEEEQRRSYERRLATLRRRHADVAAKLQEAGGPLEDPDKPPAGGGGTGGGTGGGGKAPPGGQGGGGKAPPGGGLGGGLGSGGGGRERGDRGGAAGDQASRNRRIILTKNLQKLEGLIARLQAKLSELIGEPEAEAEEELASAEAADFMDADEIRIWGHDISIVPGRTYRYRLTVEVSNPFFTHRTNLVKSQHHLAESATLSSQTSPWSDPIVARQPLRAFVTGASPTGSRGEGHLGLGQAQVEVYRFFHGRWWRESFAVEPGDRIGQAREIRRRDDAADLLSEIDFGTDWFVLDIIDDPGGDPVRDKGRMALVLLQNVHDGTVIATRDPRKEYTDSERQELKELVDLAELPSGAT
ncbi:MAG: hypothetical protein JSV91_09750 [Phycisphaerales bacterium]|nr:MAG: hypothetical protein JSV91_09750 [Phycisphaerales bacterium]